MGTTAKGHPYPEPTDPIAAGADAIKALAQSVDGKLPARACSGKVVITGTGTASAAATVTFPAGLFSAPPAMVCTVGQTRTSFYAVVGGTPTAASASITLVMNTGATFTTAVEVHWLAMQG